MRDRELLQQLFNDLEDEVKICLANDFAIPEWLDKTVKTLRTRLAQPEMINGLTEEETNETMSVKGLTKPKKEWVGLTNDEYEAMAEQYVTNCYFDTLEYAKAIEAKLKEKNT